MKHIQRHHHASGFSLIELMLVVVIPSLAISMFAGSVNSAMQLGPSSRDVGVALNAARDMVEELRSQDFDTLVVRYNDDEADDPIGVECPGSTFAVDGLNPPTAGPAGTIVFPMIQGRLREDSGDAKFGMPRDLNGDGTIDDQFHDTDYVILPALVRITWSTDGRNRVFEVYTTFARPWGAP